MCRVVHGIPLREFEYALICTRCTRLTARILSAMTLRVQRLCFCRGQAYRINLRQGLQQFASGLVLGRTSCVLQMKEEDTDLSEVPSFSEVDSVLPPDLPVFTVCPVVLMSTRCLVPVVPSWMQALL